MSRISHGKGWIATPHTSAVAVKHQALMLDLNRKKGAVKLQTSEQSSAPPSCVPGSCCPPKRALHRVPLHSPSQSVRPCLAHAAPTPTPLQRRRKEREALQRSREEVPDVDSRRKEEGKRREGGRTLRSRGRGCASTHRDVLAHHPATNKQQKPIPLRRNQEKEEGSLKSRQRSKEEGLAKLPSNPES